MKLFLIPLFLENKESFDNENASKNRLHRRWSQELPLLQKEEIKGKIKFAFERTPLKIVCSIFLKCENYNGKRKVFPKLSPKISPQRNSASPQTPSTRIRKPHILLKESASEPAHRNFIVLNPLSIVDFFWIRRVEQIR